ncbi:MAG TPA: ABC transporter ATP-binding protein [Candidatus Fimenecus excrementigallinarum]|uniref:ABC transporter ATP-binding protein n=1 Tax=Candidatus Fimenecus excrementigallinarum TaxID=2840816 RepID=A0A9D1IHR6_9FIRM|nr:ABC transporter ATP-binding protein [Candidatus Fimenecus excrementigallinarum]
MQVTFQDVTVRYGEKTVLENFSRTLDFSGVTALLGASGVGKTTFLRVLCGLERPASGRVVGFPARYTCLFQEDRLLPWLSARQNVAIVSGAQKARETLEKVGLGAELDAKPAALSGGMRRRVALARALAHDSAFLLLDEPFRGLDKACRDALLPLLAQEAQRRPVLLVTHDPAEAEQLRAKTWTLHGSPAEL